MIVVNIENGSHVIIQITPIALIQRNKFDGTNPADERTIYGTPGETAMCCSPADFIWRRRKAAGGEINPKRVLDHMQKHRCRNGRQDSERRRTQSNPGPTDRAHQFGSRHPGIPEAGRSDPTDVARIAIRPRGSGTEQGD